MACGILVPQPGIEPMPSAMETQSPNHWTAREFVRSIQNKIGLDGKASACNVGDPGSIPGLGRSPGEGNGNPLQILLPGKFHGCRSLVGYSPGGCKESETTKRLHFHFSFNAFLKYWSSTQWNVEYFFSLLLWLEKSINRWIPAILYQLLYRY